MAYKCEKCNRKFAHHWSHKCPKCGSELKEIIETIPKKWKTEFGSEEKPQEKIPEETKTIKEEPQKTIQPAPEEIKDTDKGKL